MRRDGNCGLARDAQLVLVPVAQERVKVRISCGELAAVRKRHERLRFCDPRAQLEEPVKPSKAVARLPTSELSRSVRHGDEQGLGNSAVVSHETTVSRK